MGKQFQISKLGRMAQDVVDRCAQCQAVNAGGTKWEEGKEKEVRTQEFIGK